MSTLLTNLGERSSETENPAERKEPMPGPCQPPESSVQPKPVDGNQNISVMTGEKVVMTSDQMMDLLARLQDILSLWPGSDNKVIGNFVMTALPIPDGLRVGKMPKNNGHDKVFSVNDEPVSALS